MSKRMSQAKSKELNASIKQRYPEEGAAKLAVEFQVSVDVVKTRAWTLKVSSKRAHQNLSKDKSKLLDEAIKARYGPEGADKLAKEYGVTVSTIRVRAFNLKVKSTNVKENVQRAAERRSARNTSVNCHFFDTWSPEMSYILGYIYADGCISKNLRTLAFGCQSRDRHLLGDIRKIMRSKHRIAPTKVLSKRTGRTTVAAKLYMPNKRLVQGLVSLGVRPAKSKLDLPLPLIPSGMLSHFVRGFFDGDGCIWWDKRRLRYYFILMGTKSFLNQITDRIHEEVGVFRPSVFLRKGREALFLSNWQSRREVRKIRDWLYKDATIFLKRKKDKFYAHSTVPTDQSCPPTKPYPS